jgi:hypothetical protein
MRHAVRINIKKLRRRNELSQLWTNHEPTEPIMNQPV